MPPAPEHMPLIPTSELPATCYNHRRRNIIELLRIPPNILASNHNPQELSEQDRTYLDSTPMQESRPTARLQNLPTELIVAIVHRITYVHRLNLALTCKHLARVSSDHGLLSVNLDPAGSCHCDHRTNPNSALSEFLLKKRIYCEVFESLPCEVFRIFKLGRFETPEDQDSLMDRKLIKHGFSTTSGMRHLVREVGKTILQAQRAWY